MNGQRAVRITIGRSNDTKIDIDGIEQVGVSEFIVRQKADGELATLILKRLLLPEPEYDIVIEGLAEVVELFENKAREAAERQTIALASFMIHEGGDDPILTTLGEIVEDAKRFRALRMWIDPATAPDLSTSISISGVGQARIAINRAELNLIADMLRRDYFAGVAEARATVDDSGNPKQDNRP